MAFDDKRSVKTLVLDTSVAIKFYLPEELREEALILLSAVEYDEVELLAPSTLLPESFNAFWQQHRRSMLSREEVGEYWSQLSAISMEFYSPEGLMTRAVQISLETGAIIYDALFLALAEEAETVVLTADGRLLNILESTPYIELARHLRTVERLLQ